MSTSMPTALTFLTWMESLIRKTESSLSDAPPGSLRIRIRGNKIEYIHRVYGCPDAHISPENFNLARRLAQKGYDSNALRILRNIQSKIRQFLQSFPETADELLIKHAFLSSALYESLDVLYDSLSPERQALITPVIPTTKQYVRKWLDTPCRKMAFREDDRTAYYTKDNIRVRSKSELYIGNSLYDARQPHKYEYPLILDGVTLHPDFTVLDTHTRCEKYIEHCGMMDTPEYADSLVRKLNTYNLNQIHEGENLILIRESSRFPLDTRIADQILSHHLPTPLNW